MKNDFRQFFHNMQYVSHHNQKKRRSLHWLLPFFILHSSFFIFSCSETKNLAEGETLYVGIKEIAYDRMPKQQKAKPDSTGVITAIGNAYNTVEGYISGIKNDELKMKNEEGDSKTLAANESVNSSLLTLNSSFDKEAYATAKSEVEGVLAYAPNNSLMGSSYYRQPLAFGLWAYNKYLYSKHRFGRWMFNTFAATPITLTTVNPRVRVQVAQNTLRNYGYFRGQARYDTIAARHPRKARVAYQVSPGALFHLDSIAYLNFPERADSLIRATMNQTMLHRGAPFSVPNLDEERNRLSTLFRNNGYYYFRPEYIVYRADTLQRSQFVQLQVVPSPDIPDYALQQYNIGRTQINVYENDAQELVDTLSRPLKISRQMRKAIARYMKAREKEQGARGNNAQPSRSRRSSITMAYSGRPGHPPLKMNAIRRFITHRSGQLYSLKDQESMQANLLSMGIFSQVNVRYNASHLPNDSSSHLSPLTSHLPNDTLDLDITLRLDKPYDAEFKGNVSTKSNGLIGPGISFSMSKQNVFRGAETLNFEAYGNYEWMTGAQMKNKNGLMNSFEWGTSVNLTYPRLLLLGLGYHFNRRAQATTNYKISADWVNRSGYFSRVAFGARVSHTYQRRPDILHEVVPFRLDYEKQIHTTQKFDSIAQQNEAQYVSLRDQFVPSAQYTITLTNPRSRYHKRRITFSVKEAGNLTSAIYRIGGKPFTERNKNLFGVPFAQYIRLTGEYTHNYRLGHTRTYLAGRLFAGYVHTYGNSTVAPYSDLFTVGGANSIRAFGVRSIGPGSYNPKLSSYSYINEMGNIRLEANLEYRFPLFGNLNGALFLDAGNVWLTRNDPDRPGGKIQANGLGREIALGTGFGLRYDFSFLVIRFDVGVGIHAPYDTGRKGYYNMTKFWDSLGFHLAVGYPF